jgi:threonine dehydrogenase-like Zn-dependent dehydrogenase
MKAVTCCRGALAVTDLPEPVPGPGHLLVEVRRAGICGSDLHVRTQADGLADLMREIGYHDLMRSEEEIVLGHEFVAEVVERGPGTKGHLPVGTPVVSLPLLRQGADVHPTGLSARAPGAFAERMLVQESLTLRVPNGLPDEVAVLTEPMAVGWHAVNRGEVGRKDVAVVIGCGPVGLAVVTLLKGRGVRTVVASDPSSGRRALATACGADVVVDPASDSPYDAASTGHLTTAPAALTAAVDGIETMARLPVPWWHTWRVLEKVGVTIPKAPVVFECVGIPGMLDQVITGAPLFSRVVVVGVCMGDDTVRPSMAINKEIDLRFVLGYTPLEFRDTLHALADGKVGVTPLVTGVTGLDGVADAFDVLGSAERHAKVLVDPTLADSGIFSR